MTPSQWQYFSKEELTCKCGKCGRGENYMDHGFMFKIVQIRREAGFPFPVTSAYRCPEYNTKVSSTGSTGPHTTGHAMDIGVSRGQAHMLLSLALKHGITGIGVQQKGNARFIHLDDLTDGVRPSVWSY